MKGAAGIKSCTAFPAGTKKAVLFIGIKLTAYAAHYGIRFCFWNGFKEVIFHFIMTPVAGIKLSASAAAVRYDIQFRMIMHAPSGTVCQSAENLHVESAYLT